MKTFWCLLVVALVALFVTVMPTEIVRAGQPAIVATAVDVGNSAVSPPGAITANDQSNYMLDVLIGLPGTCTIIGDQAIDCLTSQPAALLTQRVTVTPTEFATASLKDQRYQMSSSLGATATPSPVISQATNGSQPLVILRM